MCDTIIKRNLKKEEIPEIVYKRVQKTGKGKYISPVMGEPLCLGKWKKAPKLKGYENCCDDLVFYLKRKYKKISYAVSSRFNENHKGMWGVFKFLSGAEHADIINNFKDKDSKTFPCYIVACEIKGTVHASEYSSRSTYLASQIKVIKEIIEI